MRLFLLGFLIVGFGLSARANPQPNVVIFLTDDQGWGDLSAHGNTNLSTPHIDSLARDGVSLENFYVCAVCAPTRAEFLTGRYHPRTGVSGVSTGEGRLNTDEVTLADTLKKAGYATGAFGKWHNGTQSPYHPNDRGFDEFYGFTSGHWGHYFSPPLDHNGKVVRGNGYVVDDFTDRAMAFIETNRDRPFFCYLPYNTPHSPMMIDDGFYEKFAEMEPELKHREAEREDIMMTRAALAMCENIDWNVGRILSKLEELELAENTIVIFFSDNGPNSYRWNGGMKGRKGSVDEGGLRSAFFLRWPARVKPGSRVDEVSGAIDLVPTISAMANLPAPAGKPIDGRDLSGLIFGEELEWPARSLFSVWRKKSSVRTDRFRLDQEGRLFDIEKDRGQQKDVADQYPDVTSELKAQLDSFREEMQGCLESFARRPFTVGYSPSTTLPARDGVLHGSIRRSSKAPNNSFFENWTGEEDSITWDVEVGNAGTYEVSVFHTCREPDVGVVIRIESHEGSSTEAAVTDVFDPPLYDKSKERVEKSHYFVKDFTELELGKIELAAGETTLRLSAPKIVGDEAIDVHSIVLKRRR